MVSPFFLCQVIFSPLSSPMPSADPLPWNVAGFMTGIDIRNLMAPGGLFWRKEDSGLFTEGVWWEPPWGTAC
jgi:hypothetical protein